jgi:DNA-binding NarL/FixJ family response regulator
MPFEPKLAGLEVLILENQPLIMVELVRILESAGCIVVCKARNADEAFEWIKHSDADMALLDYREARGKQCFATHLHERGTPYAFVTGELRRTVKDEYREDARVVQKPFADESIIEVALCMAGE